MEGEDCHSLLIAPHKSDVFDSSSHCKKEKKFNLISFQVSVTQICMFNLFENLGLQTGLLSINMKRLIILKLRRFKFVTFILLFIILTL